MMGDARFAQKRLTQPTLNTTLGNMSKSQELLIVDDTEVKMGEQSLTGNFLPEMMVDIRKSAQDYHTSSMSSIQFQKDSNEIINSNTKRKLKAGKGHGYN